jgi:hypothetical protein
MIFFLLQVLSILLHTTSSGKFVEKRDCLREVELGYANYVCDEYSEPYYVPVGIELKGKFYATGTFTGLAFLLVGGYFTWKKKREENFGGKSD